MTQSSGSQDLPGVPPPGLSGIAVRSGRRDLGQLEFQRRVLEYAFGDQGLYLGRRETE